MKAINNTISKLFTQFGVNEPTFGGESSPFHYQSSFSLITMRFTRVSRI
jgi:hypothetical protein